MVCYLGSEIIHPCVVSNPRLWAAIAAAAIVLTLFGARGHNSRTGPKMQDVIQNCLNKKW